MLRCVKAENVPAVSERSARVAVFSSDQFFIREKAHASQIYHGRCDRVRVACDRCVCANSDANHRPRQHGAGCQHRTTSFQGDWRASKIVGLNVYNDQNESIGSINDLLTDKNGNIKAVVIGVGGFLGVGAHLVAVAFDKIKFVDQPVAYTGVAGAPNAAGSRPAPATTTGTSTNTAPAQRRRSPIRGIRITRCSTPPRMSLRRCPSSSIRRKARARVTARSHNGRTASLPPGHFF